MKNLAGILLIVGSLLFNFAAFSPISFKVFPERDPRKRIDYVRHDPRGWLIANLFFGSGALAAAVGMGAFAAHAQDASQDNLIRILMILSAAAALIGVVCWVFITYQRLVLPPEELFGGVYSDRATFTIYTVLTQGAIVLLGVVLAQLDYPGWLGWGVAVLAAASMAAFFYFKDMPPFTHYVLLLVVGIMLVR